VTYFEPLLKYQKKPKSMGFSYKVHFPPNPLLSLREHQNVTETKINVQRVAASSVPPVLSSARAPREDIMVA
jgi:hypothetical protein